MKHQIANDGTLEIAVSSNSMKILQDVHESIDFHSKMRRTTLFEYIMQTHGKYENKVRNNLLCPIMDLLQQNFYGTVTIKKYL